MSPAAKIILIFCLGLIACSQAKDGDVIVHGAQVLDGDSLFVKTADNLSVEIRLAEIDAPERDQAHADDSRKALLALVDGQKLRVVVYDHDRYNRTVAHLYRLGDNLHINAAMVEGGHAWVYERFSRDKSLLELQETAKTNQAGLWAQNNPVAPWTFRKKNPGRR